MNGAAPPASSELVSLAALLLKLGREWTAVRAICDAQGVVYVARLADALVLWNWTGHPTVAEPWPVALQGVDVVTYDGFVKLPSVSVDALASGAQNYEPGNHPGPASFAVHVDRFDPWPPQLGQRNGVLAVPVGPEVADEDPWFEVTLLALTSLDEVLITPSAAAGIERAVTTAPISSGFDVNREGAKQSDFVSVERVLREIEGPAIGEVPYVKATPELSTRFNRGIASGEVEVRSGRPTVQPPTTALAGVPTLRRHASKGPEQPNVFTFHMTGEDGVRQWSPEVDEFVRDGVMSKAGAAAVQAAFNEAVAETSEEPPPRPRPVRQPNNTQPSESKKRARRAKNRQELMIIDALRCLSRPVTDARWSTRPNAITLAESVRSLVRAKFRPDDADALAVCQPSLRTKLASAWNCCRFPKTAAFRQNAHPPARSLRPGRAHRGLFLRPQLRLA